MHIYTTYILKLGIDQRREKEGVSLKLGMGEEKKREWLSVIYTFGREKERVVIPSHLYI